MKDKSLDKPNIRVFRTKILVDRDQGSTGRLDGYPDN